MAKERKFDDNMYFGAAYTEGGGFEYIQEGNSAYIKVTARNEVIYADHKSLSFSILNSEEARSLSGLLLNWADKIDQATYNDYYEQYIQNKINDERWNWVKKSFNKKMKYTGDFKTCKDIG